MKRRLLSLLVSICCSVMLNAQSSMSLVVEMTDGTSSTLMLNEKPEMTFAGGNIVFKSTKSEIIVVRENFNYFHFKSIEEGMKPPSGSAVAEFVAPGVLRVRGVNVNAVSVYALDGSACTANKSLEGDAVTISLRSLPQGAYVVRYGATAVKMSNN